MRPTPFRIVSGRFATCAVALIIMSLQPLHAAKEAPKLAQGASLLGGALPGGAVISAAVSSVSSLGGSGGGAAAASYAATGRIMVTPVGGGKAVSCDLADDGSFLFKGLKPGVYTLRISMNTTVPKQTQGATFGEKSATGGAAAEDSKTKHDTAKNSIGNIRAREGNQSGGVSVASGDVNGDGLARSDMPNRISMNVTVPKQNLVASEDGESVQVQVGADGTLTGRTSVNQQQQGAGPASSGRTTPKPTAPSGGTPPPPSGG